MLYLREAELREKSSLLVLNVLLHAHHGLGLRITLRCELLLKLLLLTGYINSLNIMFMPYCVFVKYFRTLPGKSTVHHCSFILINAAPQKHFNKFCYLEEKCLCVFLSEL